MPSSRRVRRPGKNLVTLWVRNATEIKVAPNKALHLTGAAFWLFVTQRLSGGPAGELSCSAHDRSRRNCWLRSGRMTTFVMKLKAPEAAEGQDGVAAPADRIEVFYLPRRSPELHADE